MCDLKEALKTEGKKVTYNGKVVRNG